MRYLKKVFFLIIMLGMFLSFQQSAIVLANDFNMLEPYYLRDATTESSIIMGGNTYTSAISCNFNPDCYPLVCRQVDI